MTRPSVFRRIMMVAVLVLLFTSITTAYAQEEGEDSDDDYDEEDEPEYEREESGTVWIQTGWMTVMLDPNLPAYQYWYTADENGSLARFRVAYPMMVEFEDDNGDGAYQLNETLSYIPLEAFEWTLQTGAITNDKGFHEEVYASYAKGGLTGEDWEDDWYEDWMPGAGEDDDEDEEDDEPLAYADDEEDDFDEEELDLTIYEETTVQLYAHIYLNDYNGSVTDDEGVQANYSITGGTELKIDIEIGNFPFSSNTSKVTLLNFLQEDIASDEDADYKFRLHEEDGEHEIESEDEWEFEDDIVEIFENLDEDGDGEADDVQTISLVEDSTNQTRAFYTWLHKAIIELPNATTNAVDVKVSYFTTGEALLLFLAYPYFDDGTLVHDPSLKLLKESSPITGPTHIFTGVPIDILLGVSIIGVIAVIGAAVAIRKR